MSKYLYDIFFLSAFLNHSTCLIDLSVKSEQGVCVDVLDGVNKNIRSFYVKGECCILKKAMTTTTIYWSLHRGFANNIKLSSCVSLSNPEIYVFKNTLNEAIKSNNLINLINANSKDSGIMIKENDGGKDIPSSFLSFGISNENKAIMEKGELVLAFPLCSVKAFDYEIFTMVTTEKLFINNNLDSYIFDVAQDNTLFAVGLVETISHTNANLGIRWLVKFLPKDTVTIRLSGDLAYGIISSFFIDGQSFISFIEKKDSSKKLDMRNSINTKTYSTKLFCEIQRDWRIGINVGAFYKNGFGIYCGYKYQMLTLKKESNPSIFLSKNNKFQSMFSPIFRGSNICLAFVLVIVDV